MASRELRPAVTLDSIELHMRDIRNGPPLLEPDEEIRLAQRVEAGSEAAQRLAEGVVFGKAEAAKLEAVVADGELARQEFAAANVRLVTKMARSYQSPGLTYLDLVQEGYVGLMRAVDKFDWRRGFRFSTYATWWIRQGMTRALTDRADLIRLPSHLAAKVNRFRVARSQLEVKLNRGATEAELAKELGAKVKEVRHWNELADRDIDSLDRTIDEDGEMAFAGVISDWTYAPSLERISKEEIAECISATLTEIEARVIRLRFGLVDGNIQTLDAIGSEVGLTRERIRQIEGKALGKLRHGKAGKLLRELSDSGSDDHSP